MKINNKDISKWVKALRSGKYKQSKMELQTPKGYCCLGVACDIFIKKEKKMLSHPTKHLRGVFPTSQPYAPEWLKEIDNDFYEKTGVLLSILNDFKNYNFMEIADMLEAVYIYNEFNDIDENSIIVNEQLTYS